MSAEENAKPRRHHAPVRKAAIWGPILVVAALVLLLVFGVWRHLHQGRAQKDFAKENSKITVKVVMAKRDDKPKELILPANIQAFQSTEIYPRSNGYVKKWNVDIGDRVVEGQTLAEVETPEIDQQLAQARANFELSKVTADRWRDLVAKKVVAAQEYDEKETAMLSARANLEQLEKAQNFGQISAPFAGKITSRRVDTGTLVAAGSGNAGTSLFSLAQDDPLRVFVQVPQTNAPSIRDGMTATLEVQEFPARPFAGEVSRTAGALDPASRTMLTEVQIPNHDGKLFAGMYGQVKFVLQNDDAPIVVPANVMQFRSDGPHVAEVDRESKIHWQQIKIGRDYGTQVEVLDGLEEEARLVMNPTDDLQEGMQVEAKEEEKKPAPAEGKKAGG